MSIFNENFYVCTKIIINSFLDLSNYEIVNNFQINGTVVSIKTIDFVHVSYGTFRMWKTVLLFGHFD